jgi:hypothetical protein
MASKQQDGSIDLSMVAGGPAVVERERKPAVKTLAPDRTDERRIC